MNLMLGDCLERLKELPDNSIDSIVTDPPYGLGKEPDVVEVMKDWIDGGHHDIQGTGFMGKTWDSFVPQPLIWKECLRVLKPGGHILCFAGTRTYDWMVMSIRFAGFEIRDRIQFLFDDSEYRNSFLESLNTEQREMLGQILKSGENEVCWCYGSGFPKSLNIEKALDKQAGAEREIVGKRIRLGDKKPYSDKPSLFKAVVKNVITAPSTDSAKQWSGWGTALKPANEPILLARKPLGEKTVAENVLKYGTGGINIDESRIGTNKCVPASPSRTSGNSLSGSVDGTLRNETGEENGHNPNIGRFPANLILSHSEGCKCVGLKKVKGSDALKADGTRSGSQSDTWENGSGFKSEHRKSPPTYNDSEGNETVESWECVEGCPIKIMDEQSYAMGMHSAGNKKNTNCSVNCKEQVFEGGWKTYIGNPDYHKDTGGASRFFYCAKTSRSERDSGCCELTGKNKANQYGDGLNSETKIRTENQIKNGVDRGKCKNNHPTVKPLKLMKYLVKLITPKNGVCLDPFMGSGSTGLACKLEGFDFVGIEMQEDYFKIAEARISNEDDEFEDNIVETIREDKPSNDKPDENKSQMEFKL